MELIFFLGAGIAIVAYITEGTAWTTAATKREREQAQREYEADLERRAPGAARRGTQDALDVEEPK